MTRTAKLTFGDKTLELPVAEGTEGGLALDISSLRSRTGPDHARSRLRQHGRLQERHHVRSTARRGSSATAASPSSSSWNDRASSRLLTS